MQITLAAVGRIKAGPEKDLFDHYIARLRWPFTLREVEEKKKLPPAQLKAREAELLLGVIPENAFLIALDERGREYGSIDFAQKLEGWIDQHGGNIAFAIGGADGHGDALKARANALWSLGKATWPHMLVRALIAEQLFRAHAIQTNHPYHRE
ncbi:50S rRNA methyltransferase [Thalassospira profundimaris]|uniref:Ribosomal RNA large subunit methyltransferase H n=1 Tax=Thalassospira profundimaris TaxID=502049 RepID=A0A367XGC6_9PROT|nr:23S rRNA (pseudouridine(1915)-N(3))-methyltransferase RlmH [Thalassospira profundimaris]RCK52170.1 50S rRNA methyltransferase [Thalassospira profundimaris]